MALTDWQSLHGDHFAGSRTLVTGGAGFIGSLRWITDHIASA